MTDPTLESYSWVREDVRDSVSTQSYAARERIEGVQLHDLPFFGDEGGDFCEIGRIGQDAEFLSIPFVLRQVSYSYMEPGSIKAWHLHRFQDDLWFVPPHDRLLVGLYDVRPGSSTETTAMRVMVGGGRPRLLLIPRGVAHGVANLSSRPASLFYFTTEAFDASRPDEHRLPYDMLGADFWSIVPG